MVRWTGRGRADRRDVSAMSPETFPIGEYTEKHCSHRWPLMVAGLVFPTIFVLATTWGAVAHFPAAGLVTTPAIFLMLVLRGDRLFLNWPTGIRVDADGIEIGGVHRKRHRATRLPRRKPPPASLQCYHVFSCPWEAIERVTVVTDREQLRSLQTSAASAPRGPIEPRGRVATYYLGMMVPPYLRAALVINVDLDKANVPAFRDVQALWIATSQHGTKSDLWVAPTRQPEKLRRALEHYASYRFRPQAW